MEGHSNYCSPPAQEEWESKADTALRRYTSLPSGPALGKLVTDDKGRLSIVLFNNKGEDPTMCNPSMTLCGPSVGFPSQCMRYDPTTEQCSHGTSPSSSACLRRQADADWAQEALPLDDSTADNDA